MAVTKAEREASRNQARKWFEDRKNRKEKTTSTVNGSDALVDAKVDSPDRKSAKRVVSSRKKQEIKPKESPKNKRTTRATRSSDDDSVTSVTSKESTGSIRKFIMRVTQPLKKSATTKACPNEEEEKRPIRRSQRKSLSVPAPIITSHRMTTRRSRKKDDTVADARTSSSPSKVTTAKKSNCARKQVPKVELQTVLSPALGSLQEPVSPTDSLSTTFSEHEIAAADVVEPVADFAVEEISIVKSKEPSASTEYESKNVAVQDDVPALEPEEPATPIETKVDYERLQSPLDPPSTLFFDENMTRSTEVEVLLEDESTFPGSVATEDTVEVGIAQETATESKGNGKVSTTVQALLGVAAFVLVLAAVAAAVANAEHLALFQSKAVKFVDKESARIQSKLAEFFDKDSMINWNWEHDLSVAFAGVAVGISFNNFPKTTFAATAMAMGAVVYVMK